MQTRTLVAAVVVLGMLAAGVFALRETLIPHEHAEADDGHGHAHAVGFSAGEPGNPRSPSRTIEVAMIERPDGRMAFEPSYIEVRRGERGVTQRCKSKRQTIARRWITTTKVSRCFPRNS